MYPRTVKFHGIPQAFFDFALVLAGQHVDKVDHHQAAQVAQTQLTGNFVRRFEIGVERGFFDVMPFGGTRRVNVDGNQRFGMVNDDCAARGQGNGALIRRFDLVFHLKAAEQRCAVGVELELADIVRHDCLHEITRLVEYLIIVNDNFTDVASEIVTQGADNDIAFLIQQRRAFVLAVGLLDGIPQGFEVVQIP